MKNISDNKFFPVLDARSFERFSGSGKEPRPNLESGHIPNSLNLPASKLLDKNGNLISKSDFKNLIHPGVYSLGLFVLFWWSASLFYFHA